MQRANAFLELPRVLRIDLRVNDALAHFGVVRELLTVHAETANRPPILMCNCDGVLFLPSTAKFPGRSGKWREGSSRVELRQRDCEWVRRGSRLESRTKTINLDRKASSSTGEEAFKRPFRPSIRHCADSLLKPEMFADRKFTGKAIGLVLRSQLVRKAAVVQWIVPREVDALFHAF